MNGQRCKCCDQPIVFISPELAHCVNPDCLLELATRHPAALAAMSEQEIIQYGLTRIRMLRRDLAHEQASKPPARLFG